jgi:transcriptional regulator with XRE-family HTH domain
MVIVADRAATVGDLLRAWRGKRRLSQLEVGLVAGVSPRHLSFVETGKAKASAELLLALAEVLQMPLRDRNALLLAAGFAPRYSQTPWGAPDIAHVVQGIERLLTAHDPYPGLAVDRNWNVVLANAAARRVIALLPACVMQPTPNVFRMGLHPQGLAAHSSNFAQWGAFMWQQLQGLADLALDGSFDALLDELRSHATVKSLPSSPAAPSTSSPLLPFELTLGGQRLNLFTTLVRLGTPQDVTLSELTVELFYPADEATQAALQTARSS